MLSTLNVNLYSILDFLFVSFPKYIYFLNNSYCLRQRKYHFFSFICALCLCVSVSLSLSHTHLCFLFIFFSPSLLFSFFSCSFSFSPCTLALGTEHKDYHTVIGCSSKLYSHSIACFPSPDPILGN